MSDDCDECADEPYRMFASLGDLDLTVKGPDPDWVVEQFETQWQERLEEASEMKEAIRDADRSTR